MEDAVLKHLLYTQALCEIMLEHQARLEAKLTDGDEKTIRQNLIVKVHQRVAELRGQEGL